MNIVAEPEWLTVTLRSVGYGIIALDGKGRIMLANPAAERYLAKLTDAGVGDILTDLGQQSLQRFLGPPAGGELSHAVVLEGPPGRVFEVVAQSIEAGPQVGGWVLVIRDVTRERAAQERILQQERLAAVGQLAAGTAHYFNNLLTSIIGFAELVSIDPTIPQSAREDMEKIIQQGQRGAHLIRQILDFSGKSITEKRPLDLVPILKKTIKLLKRTSPENIRISLETEPGREAYMLNADPAQIEQALANLAINARQAMPAGGTLRFQLSTLAHKPGQRPSHPTMPAIDKRTGPGDWIVLSIADIGTGIPPEHRTHIFEPFFTTKEVGQSLGLGLAQAYGIIKQHEGNIDVDSQVGRGTTFTLYLPGLRSPQQTPPIATQAEIPHGQGQTLLLVEDHPAALAALQAMLQRLGYQVLTATNGGEALELYDRRPEEIALVLVDLTTPQMGGLLLARVLRDRNPALNIVALTGQPLEAKPEALLAQGIVDWLLKPMSLKQLAQAVSRALQM